MSTDLDAKVAAQAQRLEARAAVEREVAAHAVAPDDRPLLGPVEETGLGPVEAVEVVAPLPTTYRIEVYIDCPHAGCGHIARITQPEQVARAVVGAMQGGTFLGRCEACGRPLESRPAQGLAVVQIPNRRQRRAER